MKKYLLLVLAIVSIISGFTQDTTRLKKLQNFESESKDRLFLVLNHDNVFHKESDFETQWYSRGIGLYFMWDFQIKESEFSLAPGIGYNHAAYFHNAEMFEDSAGVISFPVIHDLKDDANFKRSKLSLHYLEVPVELRYRHKFKNGLSLKIAAGLKGSLKISATSKEVRIGPNGYAKHYDIANYKGLNTFRLGPTFRAGYGPVNLLLYYDFMPLFKKGKGPLMTPFSIGIAFTTL